MRPYKGTLPIQSREFFGGVACSMTMNCGKVVPGVVWVSASEFGEERTHDSDLWLDQPAARICKVPIPSDYSQIIYVESWRIGFSIAVEQYLSDEQAMARIGLVYRTLEVSSDQMWPITVRPQLRIAGWPSQWQFRGWRRARTNTLLE